MRVTRGAGRRRMPGLPGNLTAGETLSLSRFIVCRQGEINRPPLPLSLQTNQPPLPLSLLPYMKLNTSPLAVCLSSPPSLSLLPSLSSPPSLPPPSFPLGQCRSSWFGLSPQTSWEFLLRNMSSLLFPPQRTDTQKVSLPLFSMSNS